MNAVERDGLTELTLSLEHTVSAWLRVEPIDGSLQDVLSRACAGGQTWQGVAYSTRGAYAVAAVGEDFLMSSSGERVDVNFVYELRLWCCDGLGTGVEARELRWVNDGGAAGVTVYSTDGVENVYPCLWRRNEYVQHGHSVDGQTMSSVEIFREAEYGNVVFVDELMTGKWGVK